MLAQVHSFVLQGIDAIGCEIEIDLAERGIQKTTIVGLPDAGVKESIERVRSAIVNSGYPLLIGNLIAGGPGSGAWGVRGDQARLVGRCLVRGD